MRIKWKTLAAIAIPGVLFCSLAPAALQAQEAGLELIDDPHFQNGFLLLEPKPGERIIYGEATEAAAAAKPVWDLWQRGSRHPLAAAVKKRLSNGTLCFTNAAKRVCVAQPGKCRRGSFPRCECRRGIWRSRA